MEKTAKCIKMLRILNTGRIYKVKELADLLETKERNVIDYKEELNFLGDEEGFHIVGIPGKFGGYQLNHTYPIPGFKFTSNEKKALTEGFRKLLSYKDSDYFDENGMKQNGEWYQIKLQLFDQYAMLVKERVYGKNQTVEALDDGSSILTCEMQNKENIKVFVFGFGEHCKVLEPEWLKEEIKKTIRTLKGLYI